MNPIDAIVEIKQVAGFYEVYHKSVFLGYRTGKDGEPQRVTIEILDAGPEAPGKRYHCKATSEDGRKATGNPGATVGEVLYTLHWQDLDL